MTKVAEIIRPQEITKNFPTRKITTGLLNCGDCVGLNRESLIEGSNAPCSEQGMNEVKKACPKFKPDAFSLLDMEGDSFEDVFTFMRQIMRRVPPEKFKLIASLFLQEGETRKHGYAFGQRVYVRYRGTQKSNYMSNFMSAYVLYANEHEVKIFAADPRERRFTLTYENTGLNGPSIYSGKNFKPLKEHMTKKGRLVDPDHERNTAKSVVPLDEFDLSEMPTESLDGLVVGMNDVMKTNGHKPKKKSARTYDLTDFAADVAGGNFVSKNRRFKKTTKANDRGAFELNDML